MKFVIALCFLAVAYTVSAEEKEETEVRNVEAAAPEQARACVGTKEKCVEGDDCSCCGEWDSCDCNNPTLHNSLQSSPSTHFSFVPTQALAWLWSGCFYVSHFSFFFFLQRLLHKRQLKSTKR
uniref:U32-Eretoxin-Ek1f_1 n=1 Tax=Eresus cinnaberinus TaxID=175337 RepID=A0A2D0PCT6_ERECI